MRQRTRLHCRCFDRRSGSTAVRGLAVPGSRARRSDGRDGRDESGRLTAMTTGPGIGRLVEGERADVVHPPVGALAAGRLAGRDLPVAPLAGTAGRMTEVVSTVAGAAALGEAGMLQPRDRVQ